MARSSFRVPSAGHAPVEMAAIIFLFVAGTVFQIVANSSFKLSAASGSTKAFLSWQVVGNVAGFASVLTITGLLRFLPLSIAYPVSTGLTVIGLQVVASRLLFHEPISPVQWTGTVLVVAGIILIGGRR